MQIMKLWLLGKLSQRSIHTSTVWYSHGGDGVVLPVQHFIHRLCTYTLGQQLIYSFQPVTHTAFIIIITYQCSNSLKHHRPVTHMPWPPAWPPVCSCAPSAGLAAAPHSVSSAEPPPRCSRPGNGCRVPQHSRSGDGQQQQREPRAWGHLTQRHSVTALYHICTEHVLYCLTFTQSEEEDVEQNTAHQGTQRHPPPETQRAEHWRHAAETRLEEKQSLLMRVTQSAEAQAEALSAVSDYYGMSLTRAGSAAPPASLWPAPGDDHSLKADHHIQQVKGQRSGAAQIRATVWRTCL